MKFQRGVLRQETAIAVPGQFYRKQSRRSRFVILPETGIEPVRPEGHGILSPGRLPVPPFGLRDVSACSFTIPQRIYFTSFLKFVKRNLLKNEYYKFFTLSFEIFT